MLTIMDPEDLKKYLEIRKQMFTKAKGNSVQPAWESGAVFALEEAIKAVEALIRGTQAATTPTAN